MRYRTLIVLTAISLSTACDKQADNVPNRIDAPSVQQSSSTPTRSFLGYKPAPGNSSVTIVGTSPSVGTILTTGERIKIEVSIEYILDTDSGTIALVVQTASNDLIAQDMEVISRGTGSLTLSADIVVPSTKAIQVFTPMQAQDQVGTTTVQMRAFKVVPQ